MDIEVKARDEIWTSDGYKLGAARTLHYRPEEEVNPEELLYAVYVELVNYELGDDFYVPTDFLQERDEATRRILLDVEMKDVQQRTWSRAPEFVVHRLGRAVRLADVAREAEPELEPSPTA